MKYWKTETGKRPTLRGNRGTKRDEKQRGEREREEKCREAYRERVVE